MSSLVSIIVPVYKAEKYLRQCIESIVGQSYQNLQIILVDDGSPDSSGEIMDQYARKDERILTVHQPNSGVSSARNTGLKAVSGEFITFCDADDFLEKDYVDILLRIHNGQPNSFVACSSQMIETNGKVINQTLQDAQLSFTSAADITWNDCLLLLENMLGTVWCKLFETSLIRENQLSFDKKVAIAEDTIFNYQYMLLCSRAVFSSKILYNYCKCEESATLRFHSDFASNISELHKVQRDFFTSLLAKEKPQFFAYVMHYLAVYHFSLVTAYYSNNREYALKKCLDICHSANAEYHQDFIPNAPKDILTPYLQNWLKHYGWFMRGKHWILYYFYMKAFNIVKNIIR